MTEFHERRESARDKYEALIYWAPYRDHHFPALDDFHCADTNDLSREGFSFFWHEAIEDWLILVSLKSPDKASVFLAAQVVHCHPGKGPRDSRFQIGCKIATTVPNRMQVVSPAEETHWF